MGNNTMNSYVDFGAFSGKTGPTTSYKNPSEDNEFPRRLWVIHRQNCTYRQLQKPIGGPILTAFQTRFG